MVVNDVIHMSGFFTQQIFLQGRTLREIEMLLGYHSGRLLKGAFFAVGIELPGIDKFHLAGYSQVASQHTSTQYGKNLNSPQNKWDKDAYIIKKKNAMRNWSLNGAERLIKVIPNIAHINDIKPDKQYPPGQGIPQWQLIFPISWRIIAEIKNYPDGRFIPDEGMKMIKVL